MVGVSEKGLCVFKLCDVCVVFNVFVILCADH